MGWTHHHQMAEGLTNKYAFGIDLIGVVQNAGLLDRTAGYLIGGIGAMRICNAKVVGVTFGTGLAIAASTIAASAGTVTLTDGSFISGDLTYTSTWGPAA